MKFDIIRICMDGREYEQLSQDDMAQMEFVNGDFHHAEEYDDYVILVFRRPKTWRYLLLQSLLQPYRYC